MHGKSRSLHVEGDRARREIGPSADREAMVDLGAFGMEITQRNPLIAADHAVIVEAALVDGHASVATGEVDDVDRHGLGGQVNRLASDYSPRAGEGTGVIRGAIGISVDDVDVLG